MDFQLSEEQELLVKSVQTFVNKELLPHEEEVDRQDVVSPELAAGGGRGATLRSHFGSNLQFWFKLI